MFMSSWWKSFALHKYYSYLGYYFELQRLTNDASIGTLIENIQTNSGKPLQPSLMFAGKGRAYASEAPFRYSTLG